MMAVFHGYQGARSCTSGPQPGAWGAMDWYVGTYKAKGGRNLGIYNCRTVRGGRTTSLHGEGRAVDFGVPVGAAWAQKLADEIRKHSKELGVQCVIYNRKIWSGSYPNAGWRKYSGVNPHRDHLHVELSWASARRGRKAAAELWKKVLGGAIAAGGSGGGSSWTEVKGKNPLTKQGHKGEPVKRIQKAVGVKVDGYFGADTTAAVRQFQLQEKIGVDGIVGKATWAKIDTGKTLAKKPPRKSQKAPKFPWGKGHYIGPKSGPKRSHSGVTGNDSKYVRMAQQQLLKRGWSGVGKADGLYGPKLAKVIRQFQKEKGLAVDGLIGVKTWKAIWESPVT
jgi:peptidoglycan hydrolase-like protein with peptidoglycan-binding domain